MICYLIRHGKDDDSLRGGWSSAPLTPEGVRQAAALSEEIRMNPKTDIRMIYSSDLPRARQTADILSEALAVPVRETADFREANNGMLAGMPNSLAADLYPGIYWNTLDWDQPYPGGESPHQFYTRIVNAWNAFKQNLQNTEHNVILVTHGGVIQVILCMEKGLDYSNKANPFRIRHTEMIGIEVSPFPKAYDADSHGRKDSQS